MIDLRGPYRIGAFFIAISAILHILAFLVGGFSAAVLILIPIGLVYFGLAYGLLSGWRWMAYLTFIIALIGSIIAYGSSMGIGPIPSWWWLLIVAADLGAALGLFMALWHNRPDQTATS